MLSVTRHTLGRPRLRQKVSLLGAIKPLLTPLYQPVIYAGGGIDSGGTTVPVKTGTFVPTTPVAPGGGGGIAPPVTNTAIVQDAWTAVLNPNPSSGSVSTVPQPPPLSADVPPPLMPEGMTPLPPPTATPPSVPAPAPSTPSTPTYTPPIYTPPVYTPGGGGGGGGGAPTATDPTATVYTPDVDEKKRLWGWAIAGGILAAVGAYVISR